ncbi:MAG: hypothetical protein ACE5DY_09410 [Mariprofundaceae bacterium]
MKHFCQQASHLISDSCERDLTTFEQIRLQFHMLICGFCRDHAHNARLMEDILKNIEQGDPDTGERLPDSEYNKIRQKLSEMERKSE